MYDFWFKGYNLSFKYFYTRIIIIVKTFLNLFIFDSFGILPFTVSLITLIYQYFIIVKKDKTLSFGFWFITLTILIHITLDLLRIYPFIASRMIVYLYPVIVIIFFKLVTQATSSVKKFIVAPLLILSLLNIKYFNYREQDYNSVAKQLPEKSTLFITQGEKHNFDFFWRNTSILKKKKIQIVTVNKFENSILKKGCFYTGYYGTEFGEVELESATFKDLPFSEVQLFNYNHILGTGLLIQSKK